MPSKSSPVKSSSTKSSSAKSSSTKSSSSKSKKSSSSKSKKAAVVEETPRVEAPTPVVDEPATAEVEESSSVEESSTEDSSTEDSSTEKSAELVFTESLTAVLNQVNDLTIQCKALACQVRALSRQNSKQVKELNRKRRTKKAKKSGGVPSGLAKPQNVTDGLCTFLGEVSGTQLSYTDVTKRVIAYVKEHELENPENKKEIQPDAGLSAILSADRPEGEELTYFNIQRYIKHNFVKDEVSK